MIYKTLKSKLEYCTIQSEVKYNACFFTLAGKSSTYKDFTQEQLSALIGPQGPQGVQGPQGERGNDGKTPEKGIDYFTAEDIAQFKQEVSTASISETLTSAGWVGESGPFTQTISVAGLSDGRRVMVYPAYGDDYQPNLLMKEACACLSYTKRDGQNVTFTCLEDKPAVDINIVLEVYV